MEQRRLLAVRADGFGPGSGYLVGARLALTSAHLVGRVGSRVRWFRPGEPALFGAVVVWRGTPGGRDDAALLALDGPCGVEPDVGAVRWGRTVTFRPKAAFRTWGVPDAVQTGAAVETAQPSGTLSPGDGLVADRYVLDVVGAVPTGGDHGASPWGGLSGAAVFCGDLLAGVVLGVVDGWGGRRLTAVPAYALHAAPGFTAVLAEYGTLMLLEPVEFQDIAEPAAAAHLGQTVLSPAGLLVARREVVPFYGREEILAQFEGWARAGGAARVWLVHAPGGQGKTRLARQFSATLAADGWVTVWLRADADPKAVALLAHTARQTLVVLDYAESHPEHVNALLTALAARRGGAAVRVVLLARSAGWWQDAAAKMSGAREVIEAATVTALGVLDTDEHARQAGYRTALTAFAAALPTVTGQGSPHWPRAAATLETPRYPDRVTALSVQMTALADLLDAAYPETAAPEASGVAGAREAEDRVLWHETGYWYRAAAAHKPVSQLSEMTLREAMAAALLCGASTRERADALLARTPGLADQSHDLRRAVRSWIASLYPPSAPGTPWDGLQPDRLAERFLGRHLLEDPALADALVPDADRDQIEQLLTVYTRACAHAVFDHALDQELTALTVRHRDLLAPAAVQVATRVLRPAPLLQALRQIIDDPATGAGHLARLSDSLPRTSHALADWAAHLTARLVDELRILAADRPDTFLPDLSAILTNHANHLADLGRPQEALTVIHEAVEIDRRLAKQRPEIFLPGLATSLNTLASLAEPTQAAIVILEVVEIYQRLAADRPTQFVADLAASMNNLALALGGLKLWERAAETGDKAVFVYRGLNEQIPDAFLPELATSLNTLALSLVGLRQPERALDAIAEAAGIRRRLAADHPDEFVADLAASLHILAVNLTDLGRLTQAATVIPEPVEIYRRLAAANPAAYQTPLELSLQLLDWLQDNDGTG